MARTTSNPAVRVCPYYQIRQLTPRDRSAGAVRIPACTALQHPEPLDHEQATALCRSGAYRECGRFRGAQRTGASARPLRIESSLARRLLISALWVVGIPTAITLLILIAAWFTENVWVPTELIVDYLFPVPW